MRHIVTQDRDQIYPFTGGEYLYTAASIHDGTLMGINLMMSNKALGTFNSLEEAMEEINRIFNCKDEVYTVSGYSNGGETEW